MEVVSYKCPNCGAPLSFGIDEQAWACKFCGADFSLEDLKGREAKPNRDTAEPQAEAAGPTLDAEEATAYECPSCGGRIVTDKNTAATFCVYCHNPTVIASRLRNDGRPEWILPFRLKKEEAVQAVQKLCKGKPLLPRAFRDSVHKGEVSGLYVPFWLFSGEMDVELNATAQNIMTWSDSKYRYTKTDTYSVRRAAEISVQNVPADGSQKMDDALMEALEPYDYKGLKQFAMEYISGHFAETYDVDAKESEGRVAARLREGASNLIRGQVQGYTAYQVQNLDVRTKYLKHTYAMLPVWTLMHTYKGKSYYFAMNGQTGKMVGKLPVSWAKAGLFFAGSWLASFLILLLAVIF